MNRLPQYEQDFAFGQLMLTLRTAIGLTQAGLAQYLGVSRRSVGDWEAGNNYPKPEHLKHFIELAFQQKAFPTGREEEEIRALWRTARQKVLLDEVWLGTLLVPRAPPLAIASDRMAEEADGAAPAPVPSPLATNPADLPSAPTTDAGSHPPEGTQYAPWARRERQGILRERKINLPSQVTIFFGREAELAEITRILTDPACRLLTLLGPGGVGKTRLAIEVAARLSELKSPGQEEVDAFRDGVAFVPLASIGTPNQIASSIGEALHLSFAGQQHTTDYLLDYLYERQMLLVLDNFEHLLDGADVVSAIIESAPGVIILITSLERLNLQAEWLFDVEGLAYPVQSQRQRGEDRPFANLVDLAEYSAVQLFVQRARQIQPGLALTESNLATVAQISQHVAGMPLAIELAATSVRTLPIDKIEQQLRTNLNVLETTLRDVPARHRSMRAAFDHSWKLLSEPERVLFSRLAVFRGGCTVEGAEQVAGGTLQLLTTLVEKSLLCLSGSQREAATDWTDRATHHAEAPTSGVRFFLLEPLREYALEKLGERGEVEKLQRAHAEFYLARAEAVEAQWNSPTADEAITQLDRPNNNIRAALQWALDTSRAEGGRTADDRSSALLLGLRLAVILRRYWQRRGYFSEGRAWLEDLLAQDPSTPDASDQDTTAYLTARLHAFDAAAWLASDQNDYARSEQLFEQSTALRRILGEPEGQTSMLVHAARQARSAGQYQRAASLMEEAVSRQRTLNDRGGRSAGGLGMVLYELGLVLREQGDFAGASALFQESLELHRELGDREGIAVALLGLGDIARDQADVAQTRKYCEQSLAISRELGLQWAIGFLLNNLALAAYLDNDLPRAAGLAGESVSLFRELHAEASLAEVLGTQGHIFRAQGDLVSSYMAVTESLRILYAFGPGQPRLMVAHALEDLAGLLAQSKSRAAREQEPAANLVIQLLGAERALRVEMGTPMRPLDRVLETPELAAARSAEIDATSMSLWGEGNWVSLEQILNAIPSVASFEEMLAQAQATLPETRTERQGLRTEDAIAVPESAFSPQPSAPSPPGASEPRTRADWAGALSVPHFYGREWELAMLTQWVVEERCQVVSVLGLGGIGKSALSINLMHRVAPNFEAVIWRSVRDAPSCEGLIDECLQVLAPSQSLADLREPGGTQDPLAERINLLLKNLRSTRTLLVIDNAESLLDEGERTGHMRPGYEGYGRLLRRIGESEHRSCLLLTSREKCEDLAPLEGSTSPVRVLRLSRLGPSACAQLLAEKGVAGTETEQAQLIEQYGGNPLALKIVAQTIADLFGGDAAAFEEQGQVIYGGVRDLLAEQFNRLSAGQQSIMYWLAILREPCTLEEIFSLMVVPVPRVWLLDGIEALHRRSLVEPGGGGQGASGTRRGTFTLQSVVLEYVTERLISEISSEIEHGSPMLLIEFGITLAQAAEYVRQTQERLIVSPVLQSLRAVNRGQGVVDEQLLSLLSQFATLEEEEQGYGPANLVALLRLHRGHLKGLDLSHLALRNVYLQGVDMQDASLAEAAIQDSIFTETFDAVTAVAISSNGTYWAAASRQGEIRVWDAAPGGDPSNAPARAVTLQRAWRAHADMVWALAFNPDERTLASGSWDGTVKLWDAVTGAFIWSGTHASHVNHVAFSPDGTMLASSSIDATVRLWDVQSGRQLQELPHFDPVTTVSWSPHGDLLASSDDHLDRIWLWDVRNLRATGDGQATHAGTIQGHTIHGHKDWVDALAFSPDGGTLASGSWDGTVKLWEVANIGEVSLPGASDVTPSASGREAAEVDKEALKQTLTGHTDRVARIAWSPDGRTLASGSRDRTIRLWDVEAGRYRATLQGHTGSVYSLAFTPDGGSLLTGSEDGTLRVWDTASGQCIRVMLGYTASFYVVDWSPDSTQLVSGGIDSMVVIYDRASAKPAKILQGHTGSVVGVAWSPDGRWLASSEWDNAIRLWDPDSGACVQVLRHPEHSGNCFYALAWRPGGQDGQTTSGVPHPVLPPAALWPAVKQEEPLLPMVLASGTRHHGVQLFDLWAQPQHWEVSTFPTLIRPVAWSPDGKQLAGGADDGTLFVWDAREGIPPHTPVQRLAGHHSLIRSVAWSPSGKMLASGSGSTDGGEIFLWDPESRERVAAFHEHSGITYAVAWGPSEDILVSGSGDGALRWWNVQSGECLWVRPAHQGTVQSLRRSPDGTMLASCGDDGAIMIWDLQTGEHLQTLRRDRPYERLDITGIKGLTAAQKATLRQLGAIEHGTVTSDQ